MTKDMKKIDLRKYVSMKLVEGSEVPRFYLPVYRPMERYAMEVWIFPLAIFVWLWRVLGDIFHIIWRDCLDLQRDLMIWRKRGKL